MIREHASCEGEFTAKRRELVIIDPWPESNLKGDLRSAVKSFFFPFEATGRWKVAIVVRQQVEFDLKLRPIEKRRSYGL